MHTSSDGLVRTAYTVPSYSLTPRSPAHSLAVGEPGNGTKVLPGVITLELA